MTGEHSVVCPTLRLASKSSWVRTDRPDFFVGIKKVRSVDRTQEAVLPPRMTTGRN